jgi:CRP-like cAMP-binding protein
VHKELLPIVECPNKLLSTLGEHEYRALLPHLRRRRLGLREVVCARGETSSGMFFPCSCVLSTVTMMADGTVVETGTVGSEGFAGIDLVLGSDTCGDTVFCQVEGDCLWLSAAAFQRAVANDTGLRRVTLRFLGTYVGLVSQSVACNRLHKVEARFARWMLMTSDRVGRAEFYLTQDFIAQMLGVHRPTVNTVARAFQEAGFIAYSRGRIAILDRAGLERASCECYAVCARQVDALLQPFALAR